MEQTFPVKTFVGRIKSIYRKKTDEELTVYISFETGENIKLLAANDMTDLFEGMKKGSVITIKTARGMVVFVKLGVHLPEEGVVELIKASRLSTRKETVPPWFS